MVIGEALVLIFGFVGLVGFGIYATILHTDGKPIFPTKALTAPNNCKHKRWTRWEVEQLKAIHLYEGLDDGNDLPDRVDTYMTRECVVCGLPQAKTVRGIDSPHFK